jgi:hypothetical protein
MSLVAPFISLSNKKTLQLRSINYKVLPFNDGGISKMKKTCKWMLILVSVAAVSLTLYASSSEVIELKPAAASTLPEDLILSELKSLTVGPDGSVFAISVKECFVVKFSPGLKYQTHFGRCGNGPGEFKTTWMPMENRLSVAENGDVYVYDYNPGRLIVFSNNGTYKKDINLQRNFRDVLKGNFSEVRVVGKGMFAARQNIPPQTINAVLFSLEPPAIKLETPAAEKKVFVKSGDTYVVGIKRSYYGDNYKIVIDSGKAVFADSQKFRFQVYSAGGEKILEISDEKRVMNSFSDREIDKISEEFKHLKDDKPPLFNKLIRQLKDRKNAIADVKFANDKIFIFPVREDITVENKYPVVIYDLKGKIIKKGLVEKIPEVIWGNYAYFLGRNKNDDPVILKHKIHSF